VIKLFPTLDPKKIVFTPNFVPREEYEEGFAVGVTVTVDAIYPLEHWPEVFANKSIFLRIDTGTGRGHHQHVKTAGELSKFGIPLSDIEKAALLVKSHNIKVIGLHSHVGSGILKETENWMEVAELLVTLVKYFPEVKMLNLGGGFGVVYNSTTDFPLNLEAVGHLLDSFKKKFPNFELLIEPGRYIVAESGILLAKVTQIKDKGDHRYIGVNAGFNTLIRPMLYNAYHNTVNLSKLDKPLVSKVSVVGIICESGDIFAKDRDFPETEENDIILIENTGAYGRSMASYYNLREPAKEVFLPVKE